MAARITIISGSIGAGHDGVADELLRRLRGHGCEVTRLDFLDLLPRRLGRLLCDSYAAGLVRTPRTWERLLGAAQHRPAVASFATAATWALAARRTRTALTSRPDLVISVYPLASQVLGRLRGRGELAAPVVTFLTDMSVHRLWVAPAVDLHLALHDEPARQATAAGATRVEVAGPVVRPQFRPTTDRTERTRIRDRYAIPGGRPVALVVAGSWGVGAVAQSAADLADAGYTPVTVCGTNTALARELTARGLGVALGWVDDLAPLIRASDVVVQNAGGLSSLEALACGAPVLSYRCLAGHGQTNAAALELAGWASWPRDPAALRDALAAVRTIRRLPAQPVAADAVEQVLGLLPAHPVLGVAA